MDTLKIDLTMEQWVEVLGAIAYTLARRGGRRGDGLRGAEIAIGFQMKSLLEEDATLGEASQTR
jgi:hypothetical protein